MSTFDFWVVMPEDGDSTFIQNTKPANTHAITINKTDIDIRYRFSEIINHDSSDGRSACREACAYTEHNKTQRRGQTSVPWARFDILKQNAEKYLCISPRKVFSIS